MKTLTAFLLLLLALPALGQLKITDYPDLGAAIDSGDWLLMHDTSTNQYRKIGPANLLASKQDISPTLTQIAGLTDPNADRLLFWDDSAGTGGEWKHLTLGTGLSITDTTINAAAGGLSISGTRVPYGDGAGGATSEAGFEYDATLNILRAGAFNMAGTMGLSTNGSGFLTLTNIFSGEDLSVNLGVGGGNTVFLTSTTGVNLWDFGSMDVKVPTEAYDATGWNGDLTVPTKDAVRDKIEALTVGSAGLTATLVGYGDGSNNLTGEAGFEYNATTNTLAVPNLSVTTLNTTSLNSDGLFLVEEEGSGTQTVELYAQSSHAANRRLGIAIADADTEVTFPSSMTVAGITVSNSWADGVKQTFNPNGTNAGLNVGSHTADPSSPANGDLWYDSTANELTARINGANVALGAGGGGGSVATDTIWAAKGDLAVATGNDAASVLTAGANGRVLTADSSTATGLNWAPAGGSILGFRQNVFLWEEMLINGSWGSNQMGVFGFLRTASGTGTLVGSAGAGATDVPGVIWIDCGTTTTGVAGILNDASSIVFGGGNHTVEWRVLLPSLADGTESYTLRVGFLDSTTADGTDGVFFRYSQANANWIIVARGASTETATTTSTAVSASTWTRLGIVVTGTSSAEFFVNGTSVGTISDANIPQGTERTGIGASMTKTAGTTSREVRVDYVGYQVALTTSR